MLFLSKAYLLPNIGASEKQIKEALSIIRRSKFLAYCVGFADLVQDRLILEQTEYEKVVQSALKHYQRALKEKDIVVAIYEAIILSVAYVKLSAYNKAQQSLILAMDLAEPDHIAMPFVEYIKDIDNELKNILAQGKYLDFIQDIHKVLAEGASGIQRKWLKEVPCKLTERERQIASLVATGMSNKDIANRLNLAEVTIEKTLTSVYAKLGVSNRVALAGLINNK